MYYPGVIKFFKNQDIEIKRQKNPTQLCLQDVGIYSHPSIFIPTSQPLKESKTGAELNGNSLWNVCAPLLKPLF